MGKKSKYVITPSTNAEVEASESTKQKKQEKAEKRNGRKQTEKIASVDKKSKKSSSEIVQECVDNDVKNAENYEADFSVKKSKKKKSKNKTERTSPVKKLKQTPEESTIVKKDKNESSKKRKVAEESEDIPPKKKVKKAKATEKCSNLTLTASEKVKKKMKKKKKTKKSLDDSGVGVSLSDQDDAQTDQNQSKSKTKKVKNIKGLEIKKKTEAEVDNRDGLSKKKKGITKQNELIMDENKLKKKKTELCLTGNDENDEGDYGTKKKKKEKKKLNEPNKDRKVKKKNNKNRNKEVAKVEIAVGNDEEKENITSTSKVTSKSKKKKKNKNANIPAVEETQEGELGVANTAANNTDDEIPSNSNLEAGQWTTAAFETEERQHKFLRLMGGFKKPGQSKGLFGSLGKKCANQALNHSEEKTMSSRLESDFNRAMEFRLGTKMVGLGYTPPPGANKKFHIDVDQSKSTKFD